MNSQLPVSSEKLANFAQGVVVPLNLMFERVKKEPPTRFIWGEIPEKSLGFIYGPSKSGKTIFCECLGLSIAKGESSFWGSPIKTKNNKVLFISLEEYYKGRSERNMAQVEALSNDGSTDWINNYYVLNEGLPNYIDTDEDWIKLEAVIATNKPDLVFIDSLTHLTMDKMENSDVARKICKRLRAIVNKHSVSIVVIHHTPKIGEEQPLTIHNMAGSRVFAQEADFIYGIRKTAKNKRYYKKVALRYADDNIDTVQVFEFQKDAPILIPTTKENELQLLRAPDGRIDTANYDLILSHLELNYPEEKVKFSELKREFVDESIMSYATLNTNLKKLVNDGKIEKVEHGMYRLAS